MGQQFLTSKTLFLELTPQEKCLLTVISSGKGNDTDIPAPQRTRTLLKVRYFQ